MTAFTMNDSKRVVVRVANKSSCNVHRANLYFGLQLESTCNYFIRRSPYSRNFLRYSTSSCILL